MTRVLLVLALAGCAAVPPPVPRPEVVEKRVPVPCIAEMPAAPQIATDAELRALDRYKRTLRLKLDRDRLRDHAAELAAVLEACRKP